MATSSKAIPQPQHIFTTAEYRELLERYRLWKGEQDRVQLQSDKFDKERYLTWKKELLSFYDEYLSHLPTYLLARCPICGGRVWDKVDTYSLNGFGWWGYGSPDARFHWSDTQDKLESDCGHAQLMTWSINLNGLTPDDVFIGTPRRPFEINSERPRLMLWPMEVQATRTCAVIHALPIGRFDDPQPQHRYTAYFVTYFAEDVRVFRDVAERGDMSIFAFQVVEYDFDLVKWVRAGRLFWLDPNDPELPLRGGPVEAFPYANVQGRGEEERLKIIDGQVKVIRLRYD